MSDLVAFLRARLDEDEQVARRAAGVNAGGTKWWSSWSYDRDKFRVAIDETTWVAAAETGDAGGEHISRWDPARVLAEVEAKRGLIDWYAEVNSDRDLRTYDQFGSLGTDPNALAVTLAVESLRLLARPYADHTDYDPAWVVETGGD